MSRGKKPTYVQRKLLQHYQKNPADWLYLGHEVTHLDGSKQLGKNKEKVMKIRFIHRKTGEEICLEF